jgi:hypothetical protein
MGEGASALGLYWLPENPGWSREAAALDQAVAGERTWRKLVELANARLDLIRTIRLDRLLQRLFGDNPPSHLSTRPVRLAVLGSSVTTHLLPGIRVAGLRRDLWVKTYLLGLKMQLIWGRFDADNLQRIVQLINKTNQFNLVTKRCTEEEILRSVRIRIVLACISGWSTSSATMALSPS